MLQILQLIPQCLKKKFGPFTPTIKGLLRLASGCPLSLSSCFFPAGILHSHQAAWLRGSPCMAAPILLHPALAYLLCGACTRSLIWGNLHFSISPPDISNILGLYPFWPSTPSLGGKSVLPRAPSPMLDTDQGPRKYIPINNTHISQNS